VCTLIACRIAAGETTEYEKVSRRNCDNASASVTSTALINMPGH
jgi:hypothetical protein